MAEEKMGTYIIGKLTIAKQIHQRLDFLRSELDKHGWDYSESTYIYNIHEEWDALVTIYKHTYGREHTPS